MRTEASWAHALTFPSCSRLVLSSGDQSPMESWCHSPHKRDHVLANRLSQGR